MEELQRAALEENTELLDRIQRDNPMEELQRAALVGNTELLDGIQRDNPLLLDRVLVGACMDETPLHVALLRGHVDFATQLLNLNPNLAEALDSQRCSPLHLASAKGYVEIVKALISAKPDMCTAVNREGLNPLHLAAIKGKVEVLRELVRERRPQVALALGATVNHGETILHLCVKHRQMDALKLLVEETRVDDDQIKGLLNAKDDYGYTILHLAVAEKQIEAVQCLVSRVDVNAKNANGFTALDVLTRSRRGVEDWDIGNSLQNVGALKTTPIIPPSSSSAAGNGNSSARPVAAAVTHSNIHDQSSSTLPLAAPLASNLPTHLNAHAKGSNPQMPSFLRNFATILSGRGDDKPQHRLNDQGQWLSKKRDALMVVASLLATMAFQAGVSPPGGVWQDDSKPDSPIKYRAGEAVVAYNYKDSYKYYLRANTISFVASLSTILLLISGLPFRRRTFMWILMVIMWLSITAMAITYGYAIVAVTPIKDRKSLRRTMYVAVPVWCGVMGLLLLGHTVRLTEIWLKKKGKDIWYWEPVRKFCASCGWIHPNANANVNANANTSP